MEKDILLELTPLDIITYIFYFDVWDSSASNCKLSDEAVENICLRDVY